MITRRSCIARAARTIGLALPRSLLVRADQVVDG
jgi:hypothetical protein